MAFIAISSGFAFADAPEYALKAGQAISFGDKVLVLSSISPIGSGFTYPSAYFELWQNGARIDYFAMDKSTFPYNKNGIIIKVRDVLIGSGSSSYATFLLHPSSSSRQMSVGDDDKAWAYHDKLFTNQASLGTDNYKNWAAELGVDATKFNSCLANGEPNQLIDAHLNEGMQNGVQGTPGFLLVRTDSGAVVGSVSGAQSYDVFKKAIDDALNYGPTPTPMPGKRVDLGNAAVKGSSSAKIALVEYSDFQCPFCANFFSQTLWQIDNDYVKAGKIEFVYKNFPLDSIHPNARPAAIAFECVRKLYSVTAGNYRIQLSNIVTPGVSGASDAYFKVIDGNGALIDYFSISKTSSPYVKNGIVIDVLDVATGSQPSAQVAVYGTSQMINVVFTSAPTPTPSPTPIPTPTVTPSPTPTPKPSLRVDLGNAALKGSASAKIALVEYSDFQCPFCANFFSQTLWQIDNDYVKAGKIEFVYKNFPLESIHPNARPAAIAAECVRKLDAAKFWPYIDKLFHSQQALGDENYKLWAGEVGVDAAGFNSCYSAKETNSLIDNHLAEGLQNGIQGTPGFLIVRTDSGAVVGSVSGAQSYEVFKRAIDDALNYWPTPSPIVTPTPTPSPTPSPQARQQFKISIRRGWNLFSVPVYNVGYADNFDYVPARIPYLSQNTCNPAPAFAFVNGNYKRFEVRSLDASYGYWFKSPFDCEMVFEGAYATTPANYVLSLKQGWNLVTAPIQSIDFSQALEGKSCAIASGLWKWENGAYSKTTLLEAGKAYWVKASSQCV